METHPMPLLSDAELAEAFRKVIDGDIKGFVRRSASAALGL